MNEKIGFFEASPGNKSSSRLGSFITLLAALLLATVIIGTGCYISFINKEVNSLIAAAAAAGTAFSVIGGGAMVYMYNQKKQEKTGEIK